MFGVYDRYYGNRYASQYAMLPYAIRKHVIGPLLARTPDGGIATHTTTKNPLI